MNILRRVTLIAGMTISILVLTLSLAGIVAVWLANTPVKSAALGVLAPVERTLAEVSQTTAEMSQVMGDVSNAVGTVRSRADDLGQQVANLDKTLQAVGTAVGERVGPLVEVLGKGAGAVQDAVDSVQGIVQRINALPLIEIEVPAVNKLEQVHGDMQRVAADLQLLRDATAQPKRGLLEGAFAVVTDPLAALDKRVQTLHAKVEETHDRAVQAHATVVMLQEKLPLWIDLASLAITVVLAWLAVSQVAVFRLCRDALVKEKRDEPWGIKSPDPA